MVVVDYIITPNAQLHTFGQSSLKLLHRVCIILFTLVHLDNRKNSQKWLSAGLSHDTFRYDLSEIGEIFAHRLSLLHTFTGDLLA